MHSHGIEFHSIGKSKVSYTVNSKPHHYDNIEGEWSSGSMPMRHSALPAKGRKGLARSTADQLYFQLKEFEEFRNPSFNTLYVQTPRPRILSDNPFMAALSATIAETAELLAPIGRLFVPNNSLRDKLPHFRDDYSPLPNTVRPRVQKLLKANIEYAERQAALSAEAANEWRQMQKARREARKDTAPPSHTKPLPVPRQLTLLEQTFGRHGEHAHAHEHSHAHGHGHVDDGHVHIPQPRFYTHEIPAHWVVPALNLGAYWYLCGLGGLFKQWPWGQ